MKWTYRRYRLWVINTTSAAFLYKWDNWKFLVPSIDNLLKLTTEQAYIRTFQGFEHENRWLGFGRMKWSEENNKKWTTKYQHETNEKKWEFFGTEIWAPDWNQFCNSSIPPDIYVKLHHDPTSELMKEGIIIAIPRRLAIKHSAVVELEIKRLTMLVPDSKLTMITRYWWSGWRFPNQIEHMNEWELKKVLKTDV